MSEAHSERGGSGGRSAPGRDEAPVRYRCTLCGNLTRFDVIERKRSRSFHHYTLGGLLSVEEEEILEREIEEVRCRWCNSSQNVEQLPSDEPAVEADEASG